MRLLAASALLVVLLAPFAAAQVPPPPSTGPIPAAITLTGPAQLMGLATNASIPVKVQVAYAATGNVVCPQAGVVRVTVVVEPKGAPAFMQVGPSESSFDVALQQGANQNAAGSGEAAFFVNLTQVTANASVEIVVTATSSQIAQTTCPPGIASATAVASVFANVTAPPPPTPPPVGDNDSPGPGAMAGALVAVAAAALLRRKGGA